MIRGITWGGMFEGKFRCLTTGSGTKCGRRCGRFHQELRCLGAVVKGRSAENILQSGLHMKLLLCRLLLLLLVVKQLLQLLLSKGCEHIGGRG